MKFDHLKELGEKERTRQEQYERLNEHVAHEPFSSGTAHPLTVTRSRRPGRPDRRAQLFLPVPSMRANHLPSGPSISHLKV